MRIQQQVLNFLSTHNISPSVTLRLALSGGLDSCVLLHALLEAQKSLNFNLQAMHVHHGLSANADAWAEFCAKTCAAYAVPFGLVKVNVEPSSGLGVEATARNARYQALLKDDVDFVMLAHHQDDQAETFLLQMLRGAGLKGLSAMAAKAVDKRLLRPLLDVSRQEVEAYAKAAKLSWVEDESNADTQYDRNFCRHEIMPAIQSRFPAAAVTFARSAGHIAEAATLLDDLAVLDAQSAIVDGKVNVLALKALSAPRAKNLLRWWLASLNIAMPNKDKLDETLAQLINAKADASLKINLEGVNIRRYQDLAYIETPALTLPISLIWQGEPSLTMPDGSQLMFEHTRGQGLAIDRLGGHKLRIASRTGGERFKPDLARPTRTLKHLLQEANMPPWLRERLPLVYLDDALAVVPNVGVSCQMQAGEGERGLVITWQA